MIRWKCHLRIGCLTLLFAAAAMGREPMESGFYHGFVNASGKLGTQEELVDYNVFIIYPVLNYGTNLDQAYERLKVPYSMRAPLNAVALQHRKTALLAALSNLELRGFPYDGMPEPMKQEYDAFLIDSAIVVVAGPELNSRTPIYGVASVSYDWGKGTAGERRLGMRVPRADPEAAFVDFYLRDGRGPLAIWEDYSLLLSSRLWFTGGDHNVAEIKALELSKMLPEWEAQANRVGATVGEVRAQVLAIINHMISSYMLNGKDALPPSLQKLIPQSAHLERRMKELAPRIERASSGVAVRRAALEAAMREYALNPPPQELSLVNHVFAYTGGLDPQTGRDQIAAQEYIFRNRFPFPEKLDSFPDPDVPAMTLSVLQGTRGNFDSGRFLSKYSQVPNIPVPSHQHIIHPIGGDLIYGPLEVWGAEPPRLSDTFQCDRYLRDYSRTFGISPEA